MFAYYFYPKELKEIVKDLSNKNDLNDEAIKTLNSNLIIYFSMYTILVIVFFVNFSFYGFLFLSITFFLLTALFVNFSIKNTFLNEMASFLYGKKLNAKVVQCYRRPRSGLGDIKVYIEEIKKEVFIGPFYRGRRNENYPKKDELIEIIYSEGENFRPVINKPQFAKSFSLSKSRIKELSND